MQIFQSQVNFLLLISITLNYTEPVRLEYGHTIVATGSECVT